MRMGEEGEEDILTSEFLWWHSWYESVGIFAQKCFTESLKILVAPPDRRLLHLNVRKTSTTSH